MQGNLQINGMKAQGELQIKKGQMENAGKTIDLDMGKLRNDMEKWSREFKQIKTPESRAKVANTEADTNLKGAQRKEAAESFGLEHDPGCTGQAVEAS